MHEHSYKRVRLDNVEVQETTQHGHGKYVKEYVSCHVRPRESTYVQHNSMQIHKRLHELTTNVSERSVDLR